MLGLLPGSYIHQEAGPGVGWGGSDWFSRQTPVPPTVPDTKEELSVLGKSGEVSAARKLFVPQQVLQYSYAN